MTYRGIHRDGIVFIEGEVDLPDGAVVEVNLAAPGRGRKPPSRASKSDQNAPRTSGLIGGKLSDRPLLESSAIGMWKNRRDWNGLSTPEIARLLRNKAMGRKRG